MKTDRERMARPRRAGRVRSMLVGVFLGLSLGGVAACGGGGGGGVTPSPPPPPPPPPPSGGGPQWTEGVFDAATGFANRCEVPRSGVDIEGNAFPDLEGSLAEELFWLRSWTHETYLWNREVVDRDPAGFSDRIAYFDVLKTEAVTPSGTDKDDFHFSELTTDFLERRNNAPSAKYGASFAILSGSPPRDIRVRFTEAGTPATEAPLGTPNLVRGTEILEVDGEPVVDGADVDALNGGLFPATAGEVHTFLVRDPGATETRQITMTSASLVDDPVNRVRVIETGGRRYGYILFNTFSPNASERAIVEAMDTLDGAAIDDLVLDLRYNGGGLLAVASQLGYMVAGAARTNGRTFELLRFNDDAGNRNPVTGQVNDPIPFISTGVGFSYPNGLSLPTLDLGRVFILTTGRTCSASEAVINGLRGIGVEVVLIGDTTCGKPYGFYPQDNCGITYYTIQFQGVNDEGFGDFADGFSPSNGASPFSVEVPGCRVNDDFSAELGSAGEELFAAAAQYATTGTCPAVPGTKPLEPAPSFKTGLVRADEVGPGREVPLGLNGRDLRMPGSDRW